MDKLLKHIETLPLLPSGHLEQARMIWKSILEQGDWAIDATCGNGKDTLKLAQILMPLGGGIVAIDVQKKAIENTLQRLSEHLNPSELKKILIFQQCHSRFPGCVEQLPIKLIIYNLGYLPSGGNKFFTTQTKTTLESVSEALKLLSSGGCLTITCYPGHPEGFNELQALDLYLSELSPQNWTIECFKRTSQAPSLFIIKNKKNNPLKNK